MKSLKLIIALFVLLTADVFAGRGEEWLISESPKYLIPDFSNTGFNMIVMFSCDQTIPDGWEIGVYTSDGYLIGSGVVVNRQAGFPIWGDNNMTTIKDGAEYDEPLVAKAFDTTNKELLACYLANIYDYVSFTYYDTLKYRTDRLLNVDASLVDTDVEDENSASGVSFFFNANHETIDIYSLNEDIKEIDVYNYLGELAIKQECNLGQLSCQVGCNSLSGVYILVVRTKSSIHTFKFIK